MNKEELKKHCERQIERCSLLRDYKHQSEHQAVLDLLEENSQLKANWDKLKEYFRFLKINSTGGQEFIEDIILLMQELEGSDNK